MEVYHDCPRVEGRGSTLIRLTKACSDDDRGERQMRSVANMTRGDARDFLRVASEIGLQPKVTVFPLDQANEALLAVKHDSVDGAAVIVP